MSKLLGLCLLLLMAQQGAVVHELSHLGNLRVGTIRAYTNLDAGRPCSLCPTFAQVATPAIAHSFDLPQFHRSAMHCLPAPLVAEADRPAPHARSRGPPRLI